MIEILWLGSLQKIESYGLRLLRDALAKNSFYLTWLAHTLAIHLLLVMGSLPGLEATSLFRFSVTLVLTFRRTLAC